MYKFIITLILITCVTSKGNAQANYMFLDMDLLQRAMSKYSNTYIFKSKSEVGFKTLHGQGEQAIIKYTYKQKRTSLLYHFYTIHSTIICLEIEGNRKQLEYYTREWISQFTRSNQDSRYTKGAYYSVPDPYGVRYVYHVYTPEIKKDGNYHRYLSINEEILHNDILRWKRGD